MTNREKQSNQALALIEQLDNNVMQQIRIGYVSYCARWRKTGPRELGLQSHVGTVATDHMPSGHQPFGSDLGDGLGVVSTLV